ncbi:histidine phosphatase family protein [Microbacterium sp. NPDC055903]
MPSHRIHRAIAIASVAAAAVTLSACSPAAEEAETTATQPDGPVTIYLTRHGETMLNELDRAQGWADSPLVAAGEADAEDLGLGLDAAGIEFDAAYSADMVRHFDTASLALQAGGSDLEPVRDERLREISFGRFEGASNGEMWDFAASAMGYADTAAMFADAGGFSFTDALDAIATGSEGTDLTAETSADVAGRALAALEEIAERATEDGDDDVLVVSSGITIMTVLGALGTDLSSVTTGIENAAVSVLVCDDGEWSVESVNDLSYVEAGAEL